MKDTKSKIMIRIRDGSNIRFDRTSDLIHCPVPNFNLNHGLEIRPTGYLDRKSGCARYSNEKLCAIGAENRKLKPLLCPFPLFFSVLFCTI